MQLQYEILRGLCEGYVHLYIWINPISLFAIISFQTVTSEQMEPRSGLCCVFFHLAQHAAVDGGVVVEQGQTWNLSKKFTPPNVQAKNFTPSISPNFNSFGKKKH